MGSLDKIVGAGLSGVIVNAWILGMIYVLTYEYYNNFPHDGKGTKLLVAWMWCLQTLNGIILSKMIYFRLITSFGHLEDFTVTWEWSMYLGISSIAAFSAQTYYARRLYILTKSCILSGVILLLAFGQLGFGLASMTKIFMIGVFSDIASAAWVYVTCYSFSAACDILIASAQVTYLHRHRTVYTSTNRIINTLILYTISTGLLTSILAIVELTTFPTLGFNFVPIFLSFIIGAVYTVSFLANLNARRTFSSPESTANTDPFDIAFMQTKSTNVTTIPPRESRSDLQFVTPSGDTTSHRSSDVNLDIETSTCADSTGI